MLRNSAQACSVHVTAPQANRPTTSATRSSKTRGLRTCPRVARTKRAGQVVCAARVQEAVSIGVPHTTKVGHLSPARMRTAATRPATEQRQIRSIYLAKAPRVPVVTTSGPAARKRGRGLRSHHETTPSSHTNPYLSPHDSIIGRQKGVGHSRGNRNN